MDAMENLRNMMLNDLPRIADAFYQENPNARIVLSDYLENMVLYTQLFEANANAIEDYENRYAAWGQAMGMLLDAYEAEDRVLVADILTFEVLPQLEA